MPEPRTTWPRSVKNIDRVRQPSQPSSAGTAMPRSRGFLCRRAGADNVDQAPLAGLVRHGALDVLGRICYAHTQGVFFGWLGNAFLAFLYFIVPRLAGRPVTSIWLGWVLFAAWNGLVVLPGWAWLKPV